MAIITEDYVSFEIAKLLKEKGFNAKCDKCYAYFADDDIRSLNLKYPKLAQLLIENRYPCVTHQMAMKWLREEHHLSVEVYRTACGYIGCVVAIPSGTDIKFLEDDGDDLPSGTYTKWEYACEASIKYCIKNLI